MTCKDKDYYKCDDCVDAWELSRMYGCKESPNPITDLEREVRIGDCVEANQNGERFWVQVTDVCVCYILGIVRGPLSFPHPFSPGEKIRLEIYQIYNVDIDCQNHL